MQRLLTEIRHMLLAFQIMSRIPINIALPCQPDDMIGSMVYFPLVGAVVGALMALAGWLGYALTGSYIAAAAQQMRRILLYERLAQAINQ